MVKLFACSFAQSAEPTPWILSNIFKLALMTNFVLLALLCQVGMSHLRSSRFNGR